jgi:signal transduction histidine kinase
MVAPLRGLEEGARAVAEHRLGHRVPEVGSKEMKSVAISFNRMADNLEEQERLRQNLLADVTHELRHPVHILHGNLQAILDGVYPLEMSEITRLLNQTNQLTNLVEDLHQLALAEAQQLPLHMHDTNLNEVISTSIDNSQPMFATKEISLESEIPSTPIQREVDEVRIRQAFQNILNNAYHHTPKGGKVEISLSEGDDGVQISVKDSGTGISMENLPYIFDRFYQADTSRNRENGGTGLGLAIAKAIIQTHGGNISAESPGEGQGSTFTITIPLQNLEFPLQKYRK